MGVVTYEESEKYKTCMTKLNKYMSDSYQNFFDNDLSTTDPALSTNSHPP